VKSNRRRHFQALIFKFCVILFLVLASSMGEYYLAMGQKQPIRGGIPSRGNLPFNFAFDRKPNVITANLEEIKGVDLEEIKKQTGNVVIQPIYVFRVNQTLHAEDEDFRSFVEKNNNQIVIDRPGFVWPNRLSPMVKGQFVIAFLTRDPTASSGATFSPYMLIDVIPTSARRFPTDLTLASVRDLVRTDLIQQIKSELLSDRQLTLLRFVFPILSAQDADVITPFLQHEDPEHRRAARALLLALTLDPGYIPDVEQDLLTIRYYSDMRPIMC
jgi:hypothetical protein